MVGQLTKEVEIKFSQSGTAIAKGTVFTKKWKKDKDDEFHHFDFVCFGKQAEWLSDAKKGNHIMISGEIQQEKWEDKDGNKRSKVSIIGHEVRNLDGEKKSTVNKTAGTSSYNDEVTPDGIPF